MAKVIIPSSGYYYNWQTGTLYMTYRFSVKANDMAVRNITSMTNSLPGFLQ